MNNNTNVNSNKKGLRIKGYCSLASKINKIDVMKEITEICADRNLAVGKDLKSFPIIDSPEALVNFKKLIVTPKFYTELTLSFTTKGASYDILSKAEGHQCQSYAKTIDRIFVGNKDAVDNGYKGYTTTKTFMTLYFENGNIADEIIKHGVYCDSTTEKAIIVVPVNNGSDSGKFIVKDWCKPILGNETQICLTEEELKEYLHGTVYYSPMNYTNSSVKDHKQLFLNTEDYDPEDMLDKLSYGTIRKAIATGMTEMDMTNAVKTSARLGQAVAPAGEVKPFLDRYGFAILKSSMNMFDWKEYDYEGNEGYKGSSIIDGEAFISEDYLAVILTIKLISEGFDVIVLPKAVRGLQVQNRIWTFKGTSFTKRQRQLKRTARNIDSKDCIEEIKGKEGDYIIVGNRDNVVQIMDTDTVKKILGQLPDFERYINESMWVMNLASPCEISTSRTQMLNKVLCAPSTDMKEVLRVIKGLATTTINDKLIEMLGDPDVDINESDVIVNRGEINTKYAVDFVSEISQNMASRTDLALLSKQFRGFDNAVKRSVDELRFSIDGKGTYGMLSHDPTVFMVKQELRKTLFGEDEFGLIGYKEVYCKQWINRVHRKENAKLRRRHNEIIKAKKSSFYELNGENKLTKEQKDVIDTYKVQLEKLRIKELEKLPRDCFMVKFPAPGANEVYRARLLTDDDIKERAEKLVNRIAEIDPDFIAAKEAGDMKEYTRLLNYEVSLLIESVTDSGAGSIIMPALEPLKAFLAGFDDDGDEASLVWHEELVKLFDAVEDIMVEISTKPEDMIDTTEERHKRNPNNAYNTNTGDVITEEVSNEIQGLF